MSAQPLVSAVIPSYNRCANLLEAVDSVLGQTYSPIEVVVVDDGSTDDTEMRMAAYSDKVRYVRQDNKGAAAARNTGIDVSTGDYIAFLDADDLWRPGKVARQIEYFRSHADIGFLCSDAREFDENGTVSESFLHQFGEKASEGFVFSSIAKTAFPLTSTVMTRKSCIDGLRFNESLVNFQDIDFFMRMNLLHPIGVIREPLAERRLHRENASRNHYNRFFYRTIAFQTILTDGTALSTRQRREMKHLLAFSCCKVADCHWGAYELSEARRWYARALGLHGVGLDALLHLLASFLPKQSISLLRQVRLASDLRK